jgi:hypothetical protein
MGKRHGACCCPGPLGPLVSQAWLDLRRHVIVHNCETLEQIDYGTSAQNLERNRANVRAVINEAIATNSETYYWLWEAARTCTPRAVPIEPSRQVNERTELVRKETPDGLDLPLLHNSELGETLGHVRFGTVRSDEDATDDIFYPRTTEEFRDVIPIRRWDRTWSQLNVRLIPNLVGFRPESDAPAVRYRLPEDGYGKKFFEALEYFLPSENRPLGSIKGRLYRQPNGSRYLETPQGHLHIGVIEELDVTNPMTDAVRYCAKQERRNREPKRYCPTCNALRSVVSVCCLACGTVRLKSKRQCLLCKALGIAYESFDCKHYVPVESALEWMRSGKWLGWVCRWHVLRMAGGTVVDESCTDDFLSDPTDPNIPTSFDAPLSVEPQEPVMYFTTSHGETTEVEESAIPDWQEDFEPYSGF